MNLDIIIDTLEASLWDWMNEPANDNRLIDYMTLEEWLASADIDADDIELIEN